MNKKLLYFVIILFILPLIADIILYNQLPDVLPTHWNTVGEIDGEMPKPLALFGLTAVLIIVECLVTWRMNHDPKKANIPSVVKNIFYMIPPILNIFITFMMLSASIEGSIKIDIMVVIVILFSVLFISLGNYLPKCKQSYTVGIRSPWTLHDAEIWNKTHRFAGFLFVCGGFLVLFTIILPPQHRFFPLIAITLLCGFIPFIYSYLLFKNKK